jgi:hypothetical protein
MLRSVEIALGHGPEPAGTTCWAAAPKRNPAISAACICTALKVVVDLSLHGLEGGPTLGEGGDRVAPSGRGP